MTRPDPSTRARLRRLLEAGEALRAAAAAFDEALDEALDDALVASAGLSVGLPEVDDEGETAESSQLLHVEFLADLVERLTGVVDARVTPALAEVERALAESLTQPRRKG